MVIGRKSGIDKMGSNPAFSVVFILTQISFRKGINPSPFSHTIAQIAE